MYVTVGCYSLIAFVPSNFLYLNKIVLKTLYLLLSDDMPYPGAYAIRSVWIVWLLALFLEVIPAYFADLWQYIRRKPAKYVKKVLIFILSLRAKKNN